MTYGCDVCEDGKTKASVGSKCYVCHRWWVRQGPANTSSIRYRMAYSMTKRGRARLHDKWCGLDSRSPKDGRKHGL
jgi:hypothetical protein